jgi:hypothetical protein
VQLGIDLRRVQHGAFHFLAHQLRMLGRRNREKFLLMLFCSSRISTTFGDRGGSQLTAFKGPTFLVAKFLTFS